MPPTPKRHRGRVIAAVVAVVVVAGIVLVRWHPWGGASGATAAAGSSGASGARAGRGGRGGNAANVPQPVHVATVTQGEMPVVLTALGTVTPLANVTVRTQLSGVLQTVAFQEGQMVKKGDVLAQIDPRPYQISLANAEGTLAKDQALLQTARLDLKRYQTLLSQDSIASQQVDTQASLVKQYEGTVKSDQANIDTFKLDLVYARITAPVSGRVGLRQVDPGNYVTSGDTNGIVVITQLQPISVLFTTSEDNLPAITKQMRTGTKMSVTAYDRSNTTSLEAGYLETIDNQIDTTTGTFRLKSEFPNLKGELWPGQFVNVQLKVRTDNGALVVPAQAVQRGPDGDYVYLVQGDDTVKMQPVVVAGEVGDSHVMIGTGLKEGDKVVTEGQFRLKPGSKVKALKPGEVPAAPTAAELEKAKQNKGGGSRGRR